MLIFSPVIAPPSPISPIPNKSATFILDILDIASSGVMVVTWVRSPLAGDHLHLAALPAQLAPLSIPCIQLFCFFCSSYFLPPIIFVHAPSFNFSSPYSCKFGLLKRRLMQWRFAGLHVSPLIVPIKPICMI